ncbi:DDE-type integrase/transposase/recombinase [Acinetobacter radioresistens]|nr:DDE-type integrase/transposase/recombinase [Acinetobacter radioresistens]MCK4085203.1 DDE-type integrase/transposase/recombinase [Acinetobacter radioresistens]MCK4093798.1 DDE-type integrase/transposase/recombinase [Acinetobacter radioresistens]MCK4097376.1 DDE-type integrase/transposase/recombinase [Acinetobacter radioresistens]MCK4100336.1 DDE-type integrase/transposase/recombinase [Acinetobacter radioresistens]
MVYSPLSPVMDLFNGEIIAFQMERRPVFGLVKDMLKEAIETLNINEKPMIHSDQGWQYQIRFYQKQLAERGLTQSMSRKGNCLDNAAMEISLEYLNLNVSMEKNLNQLMNWSKK